MIKRISKILNSNTASLLIIGCVFITGCYWFFNTSEMSLSTIRFITFFFCLDMIIEKVDRLSDNGFFNKYFPKTNK